MSKKAVIKACNEALGAKQVDSVLILSVWAVIHVHYDMFQDHIEKYGATQKLRSLQNKWEKELKRFNHQIFIYLPEETKCDLVEEVFEDYLNTVRNCVVRLRLAVMKQVQTDDLEVKQLFSHAYVCYELAILAQTLFGRAFSVVVPKSRLRKKDGKADAKSMVLERIECYTRMWFLEFLKGKQIATPLRTKEVESVERELCRETVEWITKTNKEIQDETN